MNEKPKTQFAANRRNLVVLPAGNNINISLVDERETPISGALVEIVLSGKKLIEGRTDENGNFKAKLASASISAARLRFSALEPTLLRPQEPTAELLKAKARFVYIAGENNKAIDIPLLENIDIRFEYNTKTKVWLGLFFDGTGNDNSDETIKYKALSNVAVLSMVFAEDKFKNHIYHYINGVGTQYSGNQCGFSNVGSWGECVRDSELMGGGFATGTRFRLDWMMERLERSLSFFPQAKEVNVAIFGFSRGATNARIFANIMEKKQNDWRKSLPDRKVSVKFLGLFDSVCSIGIAGTNIDFGLNVDIPDSVERAVHFIAAHERRRFFDSQSIRRNGSTPSSKNRLEKLYPGVHSDVGGSYPPAGSGNEDVEGSSQKRKRNLAAIPLRDMHAEALKSMVPLKSIDLVSSKGQVAFYYEIPVELQIAYDSYQSEIPEESNLYKALRHHEIFYFLWLAKTRESYSYEKNEAVRGSLRNLWNFEYDLVKNGRKQIINGKIYKRIPPSNEKEVNEYLSWIDQALQRPEMWEESDLKTVKLLFSDYIHDSIAAYKVVDGYLQKRGIFFHGDKRWIDEDRI